MAFDRKNLFCISGTTGDAPRTWSYISGGDAIAAINTAGYFNDASDVLNAYDIIDIRDSSNVMTRAFVNSNSGGVVDITDGVTMTATDSD